MKNLKLFIIIIACAISFAINISAQFQIKKNGQIFIGEESADAPNVEAYKLDTITTLKLFGPNTDYRAGSRLSFGDQASKWVMNGKEYGCYRQIGSNIDYRVQRQGDYCWRYD